jgi:beta-galactosidase/beta-glucuronidase
MDWSENTIHPEWHPVKDQLLTHWAEDVNPACPWPEYPRPQMQRDNWQNLNGLWDFVVLPKKSKVPEHFAGKILVPFPIESALSGVRQALKPDQKLWYHRKFEIEEDWTGKCVILNFGAVDWETEVYINKIKIGIHRGGYCSFSLDITQALKAGTNYLLISAWDPSDKGKQEHGKQVLKPGFIWYTAVSGIWQTVWLEVVSREHIERIEMVPDIDKGILNLAVQCSNEQQNYKIYASITLEGIPIKQVEFPANKLYQVDMPDFQLWSPESPVLYDLEISLVEDLQLVDQVKSYFGMRKFSLGEDSNGTRRLCLNNQPYFMIGPLDQGYWPDGLYTPPTDDAMRSEIAFLKSAGFNLIRKHVKVEPARYYYYCDRVGMIVWQDMPNGGITPGAPWFAFQNSSSRRKDDRFYCRLGRCSPGKRQQFEDELKEMIETLKNVVSIGAWVPFNEGWGQFDANRIYRWLKEYDPSRIIDHASGWFDQKTGDAKSHHIYFKNFAEIPNEIHRATVLSEYGGYQMVVKGHTWIDRQLPVYRGFTNSQKLRHAYEQLTVDQLLPWVKRGLSAAIYTQTTDVEAEVNGFLTYDREVIKIPVEVLAKLNFELINSSPK